MSKVNQPTAAPTRKVAAFAIGASVAAVVKAAVLHCWPWLSDPVIWEPMPIVVGFVCGWFVRDRAVAVAPKEPVRGIGA